MSNIPKAAPAEVSIYVDGSFRDDAVGYGAVILSGDTILHEIYGPVRPEDAEGTRQVAGELFAVGNCIRWCQKHGVYRAHIFYDYYGIEKWATGEWKANKPITQRYRDFVRACGIQLVWHKVESHTGNRWNDHADALAKRGAAGFRPATS